MIRLLRLLGALWVLPIALPIWALYLAPLWLLGWIEAEWVVDGHAVLFVVNGGPAWWLRLWDGWAAHTLPFAIVARDASQTVIRHELRHADQWLLFGPLFPVAYIALLAIYGYRNHPMENDARRFEA